MNLLYVEDSNSDADLTARIFERLAPEVEMQIASSVKQGIALLEKQHTLFDILLIDLNLSESSAFEILAYVRKHHLPLAIVILISPEDQVTASAALHDGVYDYLPKVGNYLERLPSLLKSALSRFRECSVKNNALLRVLFIDNNRADQHEVTNHLSSKTPNIRILSVRNAQEALAKLPFSSSDPLNSDVVLMNYDLPDMNGLTLTRIIRQERKIDVPILLIIAPGSEELAVKALQLGADDYLTKRDGYLHELALTLENVKRQADLKRERAALKETNQRLQYLITASPCILFCLKIVKGQFVPVWISENIKTLLGFNVEEALTLNWWMSNVHPDDRERANIAMAKFLTEGMLSQEYRFLHRDGHPIWIREELRLERNSHGKPVEVVGTWLDISHNKRIEFVQTARNAVLDQLVRNQKLTAILNDIAHRLEEIDPKMIVSILLLDQSKGQLFSGAAPSLPDFYNASVDGLEPAIGRGSCGTAAFLGEPVIVDDIDNHPYWQAYLELTQKAGLHACWSTPIKDDNDRVIGTFAIYYATKRAPVSTELELIGEFTRITSLAIQKVKAADALRQTAAVFENTRDGVIITDLTPNIVAINRSYTEITGYSESEVLGKNPNILKSGVHDNDFHKALWESILKTGYWKGEIWNRRKNGEVYAQWLTVNTVYDELGAPRNYVGVFTDISQIKQSEARLEHLAHYDPLTQLPNRLLIHSRLQQAIERAERNDYRVAVLYIDLDRFKTVNDSLGHPVGDELLIALSKRLSLRLRHDDVLARLGGDEFLLVMEFVPTPEGAAVLAQSLIKMMATPFKLPSGHEIFINISIGISLYPDDAKGVTELIQYADLAMYQAKHDGRNTYQFHTPALTLAASEKLALETRLRYALERNEFVLHYQPLINAVDETIIGFEALIKWQQDGQDFIPAHKFIPIAEETRLIIPIGEWVLRTACAQAKAWSSMGFPSLIVAVNISGFQFQSGKIVKLVNTILQETELEPHRLELELTESIVMDQADQAIKTLNDLKALGTRLAIDDFGTGYSSLAYLTRFPIDKLKIDRSFIKDITENANANEIVSTIVAMAKSLKLNVLAEGVENKQQLDCLRHHGCDQYQGFYFNEPVPESEVKQIMLASQPGKSVRSI